MALKGTTRIELTDVKTGEVEVIEKHNMVTNAVGDIFGYNPLGFRFGNFTPSDGVVSTDFRSYAFPIWKNLIGGLLLYGEPLKADPDAIYADDDNPLIGYASNDVNASENAMRGSLNPNESGPLSDGTGYRYVFDFTTAQGNGMISSLGLTSSYAGKTGHGSKYISEPTHIVTAMYADYKVTTTNNWDTRLCRIAAITSIDADNNIGYFARVIGEKTVEVGKIRLPLTQIALMDNINAFPPDAYDARTITTAEFCKVYATSNYNYGTLIDGGDGYIWGFQHSGNAAGNSSGNATVLWIKIRKSDWSFEEGQWTIPAQLYAFGKYFTSDTASGSSYAINYSIIKDGALYAIEYTSDSYMRGVYKIPLDNPTDITHMVSEVQQEFYPDFYLENYYRRVATAVNEIAGIISYRNMYIGNDKLNPRKSGSFGQARRFGLNSVGKPGLRVGPYLLGFGVCFNSTTSNYGARWSPSVFLPTCYLATINNLETPVTKTADKTMKITYILREE